MSEGVQHNLDSLNRAIREYKRLSGKTDEQVLLKQGGKLGYALRQRLATLAPRKGQVRQERLAALKAGEGVKVRPSVRAAIMAKYGARSDVASREIIFGKRGVKTVRRKGGRRLNLQALMVQRELNVRERGRQFLSISARYPKTLEHQQYAISRFGPFLSSAGLNNTGDTLTFSWDGSKNDLQAEATQAITRDRARGMIALALRDVAEDIRTYNNDKRAELIRRAGLGS